jgi:hypothetical protein
MHLSLDLELWINESLIRKNTKNGKNDFSEFKFNNSKSKNKKALQNSGNQPEQRRAFLFLSLYKNY